MTATLERQVILRCPLIWDQNRELENSDPEIQRTVQQFNETFDLYIGQVVLVQGIDRNCRIASGSPNNAKIIYFTAWNIRSS